jgi:hypothetical protein
MWRLILRECYALCHSGSLRGVLRTLSLGDGDTHQVVTLTPLITHCAPHCVYRFSGYGEKLRFRAVLLP